MTQEQKKPHIHAELIKAWADGAEIEQLSCTELWIPNPNPSWFACTAYRIKPPPDIVRFCRIEIDPAPYLATDYKDFEDNLKLTFDGKTKKLIKAEVVQ